MAGSSPRRLKLLHWLPLRGYVLSSPVIGWPARAPAGSSRPVTHRPPAKLGQGKFPLPTKSTTVPFSDAVWLVCVCVCVCVCGLQGTPRRWQWRRRRTLFSAPRYSPTVRRATARWCAPSPPAFGPPEGGAPLPRPHLVLPRGCGQMTKSFAPTFHTAPGPSRQDPTAAPRPWGHEGVTIVSHPYGSLGGCGVTISSRRDRRGERSGQERLVWV
eukprot:1178521-Prorocentrum_minimum.AAC.2